MKEMNSALAILNKQYQGNIQFYDIRPSGNNIRFRLKTKVPGIGTARTVIRRTGSACWHAHGHFFESLFKVNPNAVVITKFGKITKDSGNWQCYNVGSIMFP